ncbi:GAF domain-containing sensor histidine kinase [Mucilaginibacter terrigena]|uniref:histidine kinase n=1 Tax=Mucilaginibacter terrigena TaxID=2492395 RepID=A0A4Q5LR28_9SPHI|nr:GAF domain-containing sensor histidine kinase [Mucilaginibacter terrigena]RYU91951.1 GAF domain-containing sensor histidine kinase [Mucilaginibacter terrigena]
MANIEADIEAVGRIDAVTSILEVVCRTTGMGFAAVARVTDEKWIACAVRDEIKFGLKPGSELVLETTICNEIRQHHKPVVIDHVAQDENFANHHTPAMYGFQSYISIPITLKNGEFFGTLCAIDPSPALLNNTKTIGMFNLFADLISFHLDALDKLALTESQLLEEQETAQLRDQFIAILGHDLRNPVGAVLNVAQMMLRMPLDDRMKRLANILQDSSYRMKALIENILDFARGRLGGGIVLETNADEPVDEILNQVITELGLIWPDKVLETRFELNCAVNCDGKRIAQLLSNLLGNALTHGKKDEPVLVTVRSNDDEFSIAVTNAGKQIPDAILNKLFQPFSRGEVTPNQQGLGLGLYIASEIARAHGGALGVESGKQETTFTFTMPVKA